MSLRRKCTVIDWITSDAGDKIFQGSCDNEATEFVDNDDREAVNKNLSFPWAEELVGNDICDMHCERVGEI